MTNHSPDLSAAVTAELRAEMARSNVSGAELARRLEVPASWVQRRTSGASPITVEDLERLAGGLNVDPVMIMVRAYDRVTGYSDSRRNFDQRLARELAR